MWIGSCELRMLSIRFSILYYYLSTFTNTFWRYAIPAKKYLTGHFSHFNDLGIFIIRANTNIADLCLGKKFIVQLEQKYFLCFQTFSIVCTTTTATTKHSEQISVWEWKWSEWQKKKPNFSWIYRKELSFICFTSHQCYWLQLQTDFACHCWNFPSEIIDTQKSK